MVERKPKHPCPKCGCGGRQSTSNPGTRTQYYQCRACLFPWSERIVDGLLRLSYRVTVTVPRS